MKKKKIFISGVAAVLVAGTVFSLAGCGGKSKILSNNADEARTFTYFLPKIDGTGVGGSYEAYDQNPQILYLTNEPFTYESAVKTGEGYSKGEEVTNNVALRFESATTSQEKNAFIKNVAKVDILDMEYATETAQTMLGNGKLMDLTYWVENYMPNYLKYMEDLGVSDLIATRDKQGKKQYLQLYSYQDNVYWYYYGYQYRRDWILEYGKTFNTETGAIGSQTFKEANPSWGWSTENGVKKWTDEIVFPSYYGLQYDNGQFTKNQELYDYIRGEYKTYSETRAAQLEGELSHLERDFDTYHGQWPATISDWEWMLDIFQTAVNAEFSDRGYPMALFQAGYVATGNLVSSFGGTGAEWQRSLDGNSIIFAPDNSALKTYVDTMHKWYDKGWIDKNFQTNDELLWRTDEANVRQGYVGLYFGMNDQLYDGMDLGIGNTQGVYSLGMPYPVNDKYGAAENKYKLPETLYGLNHEVNSIMVSTAAEKNGKDLAALFTMLDATYTKEYGAIKSWGMTKEILDKQQDGVKQLYKDLGYPEGTTVYDAEKDAYYRHEDALDILVDDQYVVSARRPFGLEGCVMGYKMTDRYNYEMYLWNYFQDKGFITKSFYAQLTDSQYQLYMNKVGQLRNTLNSDIPKFIKGGSNGKAMSAWDGWYASLKSELLLDDITELLNNKWKNSNAK